MNAPARAVMDVLGCHRTPYRWFRRDDLDYPDVCGIHDNIWDVNNDLCDVAVEAANAAREAS